MKSLQLILFLNCLFFFTHESVGETEASPATLQHTTPSLEEQFPDSNLTNPEEPSETTTTADALSGKTTTQEDVIAPEKTDDEFADDILNELRNKVNESQMEPLRVEDVSFLTGGRFRGLTKIRREGHVSRKDNTTLLVHTVIDQPEIEFNWTFAFLFIQSKGTATVRVRQMPLDLRLRQTSGSSADLDVCDMPHLRGVNVEIGGAGTLNFVTSRVAALILGLTRSNLVSHLQDPVCEAIAKVL